MSVPVLAFFNNKGGVGKTSLAYHLAWMISRMGRRVVAVDLDPQSNLTSAFLDEDQLEALYDAALDAPTTIYRCVKPLTEVRDLHEPSLQSIAENLWLLPGELRLASFEDNLSREWTDCLGSGSSLYRPFRIVAAFWTLAQRAAEQVGADLVIADVGPNLGAINRSALIASDHVIIPLGADLFSLQGLENLGPTLRDWRMGWKKRIENYPDPPFPLPAGGMRALGYVVRQPGIRLGSPVKAYDKWINRIPEVYRRSMPDDAATRSDDPPPRLALLKHYRSLVPMAQEARKPVFLLTPQDGAIGSHAVAVRNAHDDFQALAQAVLERMGLASNPPWNAAPARQEPGSQQPLPLGGA